MAILQLNDQQQAPGAHTYKTPTELGTSTIFDKELPTALIRSQVDGIRWTVDYFNQILGVNSQPLAPDINIPNTTLKYNRVDKLDIYVNSGLPDGTVADITGTGVINVGMLPYIGDAFTATLAGGRIGVFVITNVTKEYYNTHDIYVVDYKLTYFADTSPTIINDLIYKTVRTYVYDHTAIGTNTAPLLLAKDYLIKLNLDKELPKIVNHWFNIFYDRNNKIFRLPTTISIYSDQLVNKAWFKLLSIHDVPELANVQRPPDNIKSNTIWDAIFNRDLSLFTIANPNLHYTSFRTGTLTTTALSSYLNAEYVITDLSSRATVLPTVKTNPLSGSTLVEQPTTGTFSTYIFPDTFYNQTTGVALSKIENSTMLYIKGNPPIRTEIESLLKEYMYWNYLDQYNMLPILYLLTKSLVDNTYSSL